VDSDVADKGGPAPRLTPAVAVDRPSLPGAHLFDRPPGLSRTGACGNYAISARLLGIFMKWRDDMQKQIPIGSQPENKMEVAFMYDLATHIPLME
jgi:hypothetical protein